MATRVCKYNANLFRARWPSYLPALLFFYTNLSFYLIIIFPMNLLFMYFIMYKIAFQTHSKIPTATLLLIIHGQLRCYLKILVFFVGFQYRFILPYGEVNVYICWLESQKKKQQNFPIFWYKEGKGKFIIL
jgi:hypothetical protein